MIKAKNVGKSPKKNTNLIDLFHLDKELPDFLNPKDATFKNVLDVFSNNFNDNITSNPSIYEKKTEKKICRKEPHEQRERESEIYFKITKVKKRGKRRIKNVSILHDKNSKYNIICKIKVYFTKSLIEQANNLFNKS